MTATPFLIDIAALQALRVADPLLKILDTRNKAAFEAEHLLDAVNVDMFDLHWADSSPEALPDFVALHAAAFGAAGIRRTDTVVVYGETADMLAARAFWVLELLGHRRVLLLDGGLAAARHGGWTLISGPQQATPVAYEPEWNPATLATYLETLAAIGRPGTVILDTRTREEYVGTRVRAKHGGAIPDAVHLDWQENLTADGHFRPVDELRTQYEAIGLSPENEVVTYCQGAYRAANSYLALRLLGYDRVKVYLGSWGEWGNRDDVPIVVPDTPSDSRSHPA